MQAVVTFDDVAVSFSEEEWRGLRDQQKDLYCQVMTDNYKNLTALGFSQSPPEIVLKIQRGEDPCVSRGVEAAIPSSAGDTVINRRSGGGQTRWNPWKRAGQRSGARVIGRRSLRLVKRASRLGEEEASTKRAPCRENTSQSHSHNGVTAKKASRHRSPGETGDADGDEPGAGRISRAALCDADGDEPGVGCISRVALCDADGDDPGHTSHAALCDADEDDPGPGYISHAALCDMDSVDQDRRELGGAEKTHTCAQCGESWSLLIDFLSHQMGSCKERPHRCSICGKSFVKRQHLTAHRRTHTEDRPYTCNQCGQSFRQNSTLTTHLWSHAGHKPFRCTCCPKNFSRKTDLVAHMRRHTGERPYQCPYCWDRFIRKKSLQRHLQKHSGENLKTGWEQSYPGRRESGNCVQRNPKTEECPIETPETPPHTEPIQFPFSWVSEQKADAHDEDLPLLAGQEFSGIASAEVVKAEVEEEMLQLPVTTCNDQATQTENTRPSRIQQQVLRELRRCRKSAARAQHERDCMRAAMDHLMQEMKELKEMVGTLCAANASSGMGAPAVLPPAILARNPCSLWSRPSQEVQCTESGRASPESSLQCAHKSPLDAASDHSRHPASWNYRNSPDQEDDMLPTTTIKREEEPEPSPSPEFPFYRFPQYASLQTGERLPNIAMHSLSTEKEWTLLARSGGKPGRFAALIFRAIVPFDIYKSWVNRVNLDGLRGRKGIPLNVKQRVMAIVERHFNLRKCDQSEVRNRLNEQLRTRRKSDKVPQSPYQGAVPY